MAYLVVALGALMAIAGAYAMYTGSGLIQVEQGWSAFIAGAVLLSGGFVTASVGLLIRALGQWRPNGPDLSLAATDVAMPRVQEPVLPAHGAVARDVTPASPEGDLAAALVPAAILPAATVPATVLPIVTTDVHDLAPTAPATFAVAAPRADGHEGAAADPHHDLGTHDLPLVDDPQPHVADARPSSADEHEREHDMQTAETVGSEPWLDALIDEHFGAPPPAGSAPAERVAAHAPAPPTIPPEAEALAAVAAEVERVEPHTPATELPPAHPAAEPDHGGIEEHRVEPAAHAPIPAPAPAQPQAPALADTLPEPHSEPASPAVIGRYEAEGTSYVMYADGSIEAQSAAGVYRFASMTELKDFIES